MKNNRVALFLACTLCLCAAGSLTDGVYAKANRQAATASKADAGEELQRLQNDINARGASPDILERVQKVLQSAPDNARAHQVAGEVYEWMGYTDLADEQYRTADRLDPSRPAALIELFSSMVERGDMDEAYKNLFYMERRFPNDPTVLLVSASWAQAQGNKQRAERLIQRAVSMPNKPVGVDSMLGSFRLEQGHYNEALALAQKDLQRDPESSNGNFVAGQALLKLNKVPQGIELLRKAYRQKPLEKGMNQRCAKLFANYGYYSDALVPALCYMAMCTDEKSLDAAKWDALAIVQKLPRNEIANCIDIAAQRLANTVYEPRMHMSCGHVLDKTPYRDLAISEYNKGLALNPTVAKAYYRLGHDYECARQYDKALENYKKAIDREPTNPLYAGAFARFFQRYQHSNQDLAWQLKDLFANVK